MSSFVRLSPSQTLTGSNVTPLSGKLSRSDNASPLDMNKALSQSTVKETSGPAKVFQALSGKNDQSEGQGKYVRDQQAADYMRQLDEAEIKEPV